MIQVVGLSKSFADRILFEDVTFSLNSGERVGLVGRNGAGKSTLFRIMLGEESYDEGDYKVPKSYRLGTLRQHISFSKNTVIAECMTALPEEYQYEEYRAEKYLFGLGFKKEDLQKDPLSFSGGFQIRINLVKTLLTEPNCLLLDEPTNYLDIVSLRWLRSFLKNFDGEVVIITHDKDFMDSVVTHTMGISRRSVRKIKGNTTKYYAQIAEEERIHEQTRMNQEKKVQQMMDYVDKYRAKARGASQAQSKLKMIEKMDKYDKLESERDLNFNFAYKECPAKVIMDVKGVSFAYPESENLFSSLNFTIGRSDKIGIIGKNGKGKSTLLNVLAKILDKSEGEVWEHPSKVLGHFGQTNVQRLHPENTIIQEINEEDEALSITRVRGICGTMLFTGDDAEKKIKVLSGGEKARVLLGKILTRKTNLLFLDEPTNHLDIESVEALMQACESYEGSLLVVTHNEEFLRRCVNKLIIFRRDGAEFFEGSYDEFLEKIGWESEEEKDEDSFIVEDKKQYKTQKDQNDQKVQIEIEETENQIETLENYIKVIEKDIETASINGDASLIEEKSKLLEEVSSKIEELFNKLSSLH